MPGKAVAFGPDADGPSRSKTKPKEAQSGDGGFTAASMYANNPELQGETMKGGEAGAPAGASVKVKVTIDDLQKYVPEFVLREFAGRREHVRAPLTFKTKAALLFADVSGFTQLTKTLQELKGDIRGAEDLNRILSDYFDIMIKSFMMHGGDVVAFSGDAMTVVFPGDDLTLCARQCARCALHILEATKGYSLAGEGLENELTLHAGAGAGEVMVVQVTCENRAGGKTTGGQEIYERCTCVMMGTPLEQLKVAEDLAGSGTVVVSPELYKLLGSSAVGSPAENESTSAKAGYKVLTELHGAVTTYDAKTSMRAQAITAIRKRPCDLRVLGAYAPESVQSKLKAGGFQYLSEFRDVTVLFMKVKTLDYTRHDVAQEGQKVFQCVVRGIQRFHALLCRFNIDDKGAVFFACFGPNPFHHDNDALRGIQLAVHWDGDLHAIGHEIRVGVTSGKVFCGTVGTDDRAEYTLYGNDVNMSARLMGCKENTSVLCDEATHERSKQDFGFRALPPIMVKNRPTPLPVFEPTKSRGVQRLMGAMLKTTDSDDPGEIKVGRATEFAMLLKTVSGLRLTRKGHMFLITGESGIGKTHLMNAVASAAEKRNVKVLRGIASAVECETPLFAFQAVLEAVLGGAEAVEKEAQKEEAKAGAKQGKNLSATVFNVKKVGIDTMVRGEHLSKGDRESRDSDSRGSRDSDGKKAAATVASDGKLEQAKEAADFFKHNKVLLRLLPLLAPVLGIPIEDNRHTRGMNAKSKAANTIKLCAELINARAAEDPTLIILDNVQWLDPMGWKLLEKLHDDEKNEVCIMLCMRTDNSNAIKLANSGQIVALPAPGQAASATPRIGGRSGGAPVPGMTLVSKLPEADRVALGPHETEEVAQLMSIALDNFEVEIPDSLARLVEKKTGGNPFFVKEVTRTMREGGVISFTEDMIMYDDEKAKKSVNGMSAEIESALASRVDMLHADGVCVIKLASVIGDQFHQKLLRHLSKEANMPVSSGMFDKRVREMVTLGFFVDRANAAGAGVFAFRSQLVREVVYNNLTFEQRKKMHVGAVKVIRHDSAALKEDAKPHLAIWFHLKCAEDKDDTFEVTTAAAQAALNGSSFEKVIDIIHHAHGLPNYAEQPRKERVAWLRLLGAAHLGIWHITKSDEDFDKGIRELAGDWYGAIFTGCAEMIPPQGLPDYGGGEPNPSKGGGGGGGGGGGCCGGGGGEKAAKRMSAQVHDPAAAEDLDAIACAEAMLAYEQLLLAYMLKDDLRAPVLAKHTQLALDAANVLQGRGEGLTAALGALAGCCMMMAGPVGTPVMRTQAPQVYSQTMALYNERKKAAAAADKELQEVKKELMGALAAEKEAEKNNQRNTVEKGQEKAKLAEVQRRFDMKELDMHEHMDISTACRLHLQLGLAQHSMLDAEKGKSHFDEARKLANELQDADLIWLCNRYSAAGGDDRALRA